MKIATLLLLLTTSTFAITKEECSEIKTSVFLGVLVGFTKSKKQVPITTRVTVATCASEIVYAECVLGNEISPKTAQDAIDICWME